MWVTSSGERVRLCGRWGRQADAPESGRHYYAALIITLKHMFELLLLLIMMTRISPLEVDILRA